MTMDHRAKLCLRAAALAAFLAGAGDAAAQDQSEDQQKCINGLNKAGAKVASTQGKENISCVKNAGKGTEPDATACFTADAKEKVANSIAKVSDTFDKSCTTLPDFGPSDATTVGNAGKDAALELGLDVFSSDVTGAIVTAATNELAAKCQAALISNVHKLANQIVKDFGACKKDGLAAGTIEGEDDLVACVATVDSDLKGKIAKGSLKVDDTINETCDGLDLDALFPGYCQGYDPIETCLVERARCSACSVLAVSDGLDTVCDTFDDEFDSNASCGAPFIESERVSLESDVDPAQTPGTAGVTVTNPKLLTQFPPSGPDLNRADYVRWSLGGPEAAPDAILILVPGFGSGVNPLRTLAEDLIPKMLAEKNLRLEVWGFARRDDRLEDREGILIATAEQDAEIAQDWYYGAELGLPLHSSLVAGPNRRAVFYDTQGDIPFLANFTPQVFARDMDVVVEAALAVTPNVFLGGHSAGTGFAARYASTDFNLSGMGSPEPGYAKLRGLVLFEGGGGTTAASAPLSADSIDRMIAKADGGLFGAVRDNAPRCVDGITACTIANEAVDCVGQLPPKCTLPTTSYTAIGGLQPQIYAAGEVGAVQHIRDPEGGQVILQVDQGSPGNNAIAVVPGLAPLAPPLIPASTIEGLFGIFLDDDQANANFLSPALSTSLGHVGPVSGGLYTWLDIDGDGTIPPIARPNNGPQPTTLPAVRWGQEVEVTRMDRHVRTFIAGGENASDWYYAGSGLSTLSVSGLCSSGSCAVGKAGACATNSDCSQSISLDSSALSVSRPDIANMTQAPSISIPVISFGGSNGLTPIGQSFLGFAQSIGTCTAPSCDGTPRVVDASMPNPAFPTYGSIAGGYEVYISEGYAHVDVVTAEDTADNLIPERLADFLDRNLVP
jgi:pimeloyl-ACP methyl ester carboxylesterase